MTAVLYEFKNVNPGKQKKYFFQFAKKRKLTDIYHSHDFYELTFFLKGNAVQILNEQELIGEKNTIVLLRPSDKHCFIEQSEDTEIISLSVKKEEFEMFSNAFHPQLLTDIYKNEGAICFVPALPPIFDIYNFSESQNITEYDCKLFLSYFLTAYINHTNRLKNDLNLPQMLAYAIEEMKKTENLRQGIPAFMRLSNYSHTHLARLIKKYFSMSLKQYINELRLQSAYNEIIFTNQSIEEISEQCGFLSFSHFCKIFKSRFSITPAKLRKQNGFWTI